MANVISGVPTVVGRDQFAKALANDLANLPSLLAPADAGKCYPFYFAIGEGGFIQSGSVKVPKNPDPNKTRMESQGEPLTGLFTWDPATPNTVTATGADFAGDGLIAGKWIRPDNQVDGPWYQVSAVVNTSTLTIVESYAGAQQVGIPGGMVDDAYFVFKKLLVPGDISWEGLLTATCRVNTMVTFSEANADQFANPPELFEIGVFDNNDVMIGYGTFPEEIKTNLKSLNNLLRITF